MNEKDKTITLNQQTYTIIKEHNEGRANTVLLVEKNGEAFILKTFNKERSKKGQTEIAILNLLKGVVGNSFELPEVVDYYMDDTKTIILYRFLPGQLLANLKRSKSDIQGLANQLLDIKKTLDKIHLPGYGFIQGDSGQSSSWPSFIRRSIENDDAQFLLRNRILDGEIFLQIRRIFDEHEVLIAKRTKFHYLNHGDLTPLNLIITNNSICVIDWELSVSGDGLYDIAWQTNQINETEYWDEFLKSVYNEFHSQYISHLSSLPDNDEYKLDKTESYRLINLYRIVICLRTINYWINKDKNRMNQIISELNSLIGEFA